MSDERAPLKALLKRQRVVDAELRKVLLSAARDARRKINLLGNDPNLHAIRRAQLELQEAQLRMWAKVGTVIEEGVVANAEAVANVNRIFTDDLLKRTLGTTTTQAFRSQMLAQARHTVQTYLAREQLGISLSERVYRNGHVASGRIDKIVNNAILRGASARELAKDVVNLVNPNTPGGSSYAAMRLARTELNNSFHQASINTAQANPFVNGVEWKLSASHPRPDICDDLVGDYSPDEVPEKPHPQCFCYITQVAISDAELIKRFKRGEYDDWADAQRAG